MHPKEKEPILPVTDDLCLGCQFSEKVVSDMLSSFAKGTAAGPSMMYPEHFSNAIRCNNPEQSRIAMQKLTSLVNFCSASGLPTDVGQTSCNASLTALKKKTGVRPIAVGEIFRRLVAKCLVPLPKEEALDFFCSNQFRVAIRDDVESIIHANKLINKKYRKRKSLGVLPIDF